MQTEISRTNGIVNTITITRPSLIDREWINQQRHTDERLMRSPFAKLDEDTKKLADRHKKQKKKKA
jgi:hypothetical protein